MFHCTIHMPGYGCRGVSLALNVLVAGHGVVDLLCSTDLGTHGNGQCITIAFFFMESALV